MSIKEYDIENIDLEQERKDILNAFRSLLRVTKNNRTREETKQIRKAFDVAVEAHKDMRRKSGEPYIYHPIAVAKICAEKWNLEQLLLLQLCFMIPLKTPTLHWMTLKNCLGKQYVQLLMD